MRSENEKAWKPPPEETPPPAAGSPPAIKLPLVVTALALLCWLVFEASRGGYTDVVLAWLLGRYCEGDLFQSDGVLMCVGLREQALTGQIWRLVTPAFVHGNAMHLVRNCVYLVWMGGAVERVEGHWRVLCLFVVFQLTTFAIEATFLLRGELVVGMGASGAVFGLAGYVLTRRIFDADFAAKTWQLTAISAFLIPVLGTGARGGAEVVAVHGGTYCLGLLFGVLRSKKAQA